MTPDTDNALLARCRQHPKLALQSGPGCAFCDDLSNMRQALPQTQVDEKGDILRRGLHESYRGVVCVQLRDLTHFGWHVRDSNREIINSLKSIYTNEGCQRTLPQNRIPASISQASLRAALSLSGLQESDIAEATEEPPLLKIPAEAHLTCLHGRQRLQAGHEFLEGNNQWWAVDLYIEDLRDDVSGWQRHLSEEYANSRNFSDGEIYVKIRACQDMSSIFAERKWWARLSKRKREFLSSFLKHELRDSFDSLLYIPGLWRGFNIGVLDKILALRCNEEISTYITHIKRTWDLILQHNRDVAGLVDADSVYLIQSRAPAASTTDNLFIYTAMINRTLFPRITDRRQRRALWEKLCSIYCLIPTMHTLFEDIKYLKSAQQAMKELLTLNYYPSVQQAARRQFDDNGTTVLIYQTESMQTRVAVDTASDRFWLSYVQLWLFALRHFPGLTGESPRKDGKDDHKSETRSEAVWHQFVTFAHQLGFRSPNIEQGLRKDPDFEVARTMLLAARNPDDFDLTFSERLSLTQEISNMIKRARPKTSEASSPETYAEALGEPIKKRSGRIYRISHEKTKTHLFLPLLHEYQKQRDSEERAEASEITSLYVRQCVINAFWDDIALPALSPTTVTDRLSESPDASQPTRGGFDEDVDMSDVPHEMEDGEYATQADKQTSPGNDLPITTSESSVPSDERQMEIVQMGYVDDSQNEQLPSFQDVGDPSIHMRADDDPMEARLGFINSSVNLDGGPSGPHAQAQRQSIARILRDRHEPYARKESRMSRVTTLRDKVRSVRGTRKGEKSSVSHAPMVKDTPVIRVVMKDGALDILRGLDTELAERTSRIHSAPTVAIDEVSRDAALEWSQLALRNDCVLLSVTGRSLNLNDLFQTVLQLDDPTLIIQLIRR